MYHIFCVHSSITGHLGCFRNLAIVNSAAVNTGVLPASPCCCYFTQCRNSATATPNCFNSAFSSRGPLQNPPQLLSFILSPTSNRSALTTSTITCNRRVTFQTRLLSSSVSSSPTVFSLFHRQVQPLQPSLSDELCTLFFGHALRLAASQFPNQELNPDPGSASAKS